MRRFMVAAMLVLMATGLPAFGADGDTPGDPLYVGPSEVAREFEAIDFTVSGATDQVFYRLLHFINGTPATTDHVLADNVPHVEGGYVRWIPYDVKGVPGDLNEIRWVGHNYATGQADSCSRWVVPAEFANNGCSCRPR